MNKEKRVKRSEMLCLPLSARSWLPLPNGTNVMRVGDEVAEADDQRITENAEEQETPRLCWR